MNSDGASSASAAGSAPDFIAVPSGPHQTAPVAPPGFYGLNPKLMPSSRLPLLVFPADFHLPGAVRRTGSEPKYFCVPTPAGFAAIPASGMTIYVPIHMPIPGYALPAAPPPPFRPFAPFVEPPHTSPAAHSPASSSSSATPSSKETEPRAAGHRYFDISDRDTKSSRSEGGGLRTTRKVEKTVRRRSRSRSRAVSRSRSRSRSPANLRRQSSRPEKYTSEEKYDEKEPLQKESRKNLGWCGTCKRNKCKDYMTHKCRWGIKCKYLFDDKNKHQFQSSCDHFHCKNDLQKFSDSELAYTKMCKNAGKSICNSDCKFAHTHKEAVCFICRGNHFKEDCRV